MVKGVIYTRISTKKDEQKLSLEIQEESLTQICNQKNIEIVNTYSDSASGTRIRKRKGFINMLFDGGIDFEKCDDKSTDDFKINKEREPLFDCIICKDVFRFGRNSIEAISVIKELKDNGIIVYFINAGFDTSDKDYKLRLELLFTIAENESHNASQRIKYSKRHQAEKGKYSPSRLSYGYKRGSDKNGEKEIVIDEEQAEIVRFIFEQYPEKGGYVISRLLNEKGIKTQQGQSWSNDKITRIINNPAYYGSPIVQKWTKNDVTDMYFHKADESHHIQQHDANPAIITREQFEKAQQIKKSRINSTSNKGKYNGKKDIFNGKVFCGKCGSRFVRHIGEKEKVTYMCQKRRKYGVKSCNCKGIAYNSLVKFVNQSIVRINEMRNYGQKSKLSENLSIALTQQQNILEETNSKINQLDQMINDIGRSFSAANKKMKEVLNDQINQCEIERLNLINQREKINSFAIEQIKREVEQKELVLINTKKNSYFTFEEKMKILRIIKVSTDFVEVTYGTTQNYNDEIRKFNQLFIGTDLEIEITDDTEFSNSFLRDKQLLKEEEEARSDILLQKEMDEYLRTTAIEEELAKKNQND